jgi:hypothetical protein
VRACLTRKAVRVSGDHSTVCHKNTSIVSPADPG